MFKIISDATLHPRTCSHLLRSAHGRGQQRDDGEDVLQRVEQLGEREDGDGQSGVVAALQHDLALQQDQAENLKKGGGV